MRLFLCGDVMTGRGIDQIMPYPCEPILYEPHIRSALGYVKLAESHSGEIPRAVPFDYIWGDALDEIDRREPDLRIINLETSVTADGQPEPKGINYRMHPANVGCIAAADIDCCILANNHVADWGSAGLKNTLRAIQQAGLATAGAGLDADRAAAPAMLEGAPGKRLLVFAFACPSSGVPDHWAAATNRPGVNVLASLGENALTAVIRSIDRWRRPGDVVLVSVHWGPNWGYEVPAAHIRFAHGLIDSARVDVVHGHSSHHPLAIEVHAGKPILYGCGDFINDYEGIAGHEAYRPELSLAYFIDLDDVSHTRLRMEMVPFRMQKFRLVRASDVDAAWLSQTLDRECRRFERRVRLTDQSTLMLSV
ncbi:CapA family protein [Mesorhizobium sp. VK24D]|uniref:CapA family protein n=1 Tax=Mesorhizobium album TaxID=3072314 RepID=A0ABU4XZN8_9HYPH|nr:CapA family protein [Mesorhizobium sp. VK24D]MDX8479543.1 CapA family protein [Mesorhizobium sp. VK24D]